MQKKIIENVCLGFFLSFKVAIVNREDSKGRSLALSVAYGLPHAFPTLYPPLSEHLPTALKISSHLTLMAFL